MSMLNRVNIQTIRRKDIKKNVQPVGLAAIKQAETAKTPGFGIKVGGV